MPDNSFTVTEPMQNILDPFPTEWQMKVYKDSPNKAHNNPGADWHPWL